MGERVTADLITRLSEATGPCRELDAEIAIAVGAPQAFFGELFGTADVDGPECHFDKATWSGDGRSWSAPRYTGSVDNALGALPTWLTNKNLAEYFGHGESHIPRGQPAWCFTCSDTKHQKTVTSERGTVFQQYTDIRAYGAASPAIAISIALLKAQHLAAQVTVSPPAEDEPSDLPSPSRPQEG